MTPQQYCDYYRVLVSPRQSLGPSGAAGCSHGWSEAQPVEQVGVVSILPRRGRGIKTPSPRWGDVVRRKTRFHGLRGGRLRHAAAPPVATFRGPFEARNGGMSLIGSKRARRPADYSAPCFSHRSSEREGLLISHPSSRSSSSWLLAGFQFAWNAVAVVCPSTPFTSVLACSRFEATRDTLPCVSGAQAILQRAAKPAEDRGYDLRLSPLGKALTTFVRLP